MSTFKGSNNIVTCRPIARERADKHVSVEMDSSKSTRYGTAFQWIRVTNKHFLGYETEDVLCRSVPTLYNRSHQIEGV
jgi:hypothetical protein